MSGGQGHVIPFQAASRFTGDLNVAAPALPLQFLRMERAHPNLCLTGAHEMPPGVHIARFSALDENIYRGGQPNEEGFLYLKDLGIKTIVNLRAEDDEGDQVRGLGMSYFHIPIRLIFPWSKIPDASVKK
jgi:hypothetical protein